MAFETFFKSDYTLFQKAAWSYLKTAGYLQFKTYRKPFLIQKQKESGLYKTQKYID